MFVRSPQGSRSKAANVQQRENKSSYDTERQLTKINCIAFDKRHAPMLGLSYFTSITLADTALQTQYASLTLIDTLTVDGAQLLHFELNGHNSRVVGEIMAARI